MQLVFIHRSIPVCHSIFLAQFRLFYVLECSIPLFQEKKMLLMSGADTMKAEGIKGLYFNGNTWDVQLVS